MVGVLVVELPLLDSELAVPADSAELPLSGFFASVAVAEVPPEPPLKSVTYQPEPFNWNPAAVTCFLNSGLPQEGQTVRIGSDIFCKTSLAKPQSLQR